MENLNWLSWSNPVSFWWVFLASVSVINISLWIWTFLYLKPKTKEWTRNDVLAGSMISLSMLYVFVCAFRSVLPRADVQRICLFDTWLSTVFVGRSVATIAELAFIAQWAIVLNRISKITNSRLAEVISRVLFPMIFVAECFSWYAVISTHYMGNTFEESLWGVSYFLISLCLFLLFPKFKGAFKYIIGFAAVGCLLYVAFMASVDVPMYIGRWQADSLQGKPLLSFWEGIHDLQTRWVVTHEISDWKEEIPWMSLYFSVAVWTSLALCYVPLRRENLRKYLVDDHG